LLSNASYRIRGT